MRGNCTDAGQALRAAREPERQEREDVGHADAGCPIDVRARVARKPGAQECEDVRHADRAVAIEVREAFFVTLRELEVIDPHGAL